MLKKQVVLMPWAQSLLNKKKEKIVNLKTWFECDNCNEKHFNISGQFYVDNDVYCKDCMEDYIEQVDNSFELKSMEYM